MNKIASVLPLLAILLLTSCSAKPPGDVESDIAIALKKMKIGGKDWKNPTPDNDASVKEGAEHFQHHCQVCHGLDGHNTGVPFAEKMSPPVLDLGEKNVQQFTDGQLKWIIENGIRFTGMPGWKGILEDEEMWYIVRYMRHLPAKGSLGIPDVYKQAEEEHHAGEQERPATSGQRPHTHQHKHSDQHKH
ncbi:MAG: cytochrome c [Terriglobales bacterium]